MSNVAIFNNNYIDLSVVNATSISSAQSQFPASNLYNGFRRSKVWRSAGHFTVTSGQNAIIFQETIGVNKTATVAAGEYATLSAFLTAVQTAMNGAGGASTYTVSQDATTLKIKFVSNGVGGAGIFRLITTNVSFAGMAALMGFDTSVDRTGALTYLADSIKIHSDEWVKWDLGQSSNPKAFALIGPRNTALKFTSNAVIKLQGNTTDVWSSPQFQTTLTYDESTIFKYSSAGIGDQAYRYWRLSIIDAGNLNNYIEAGFIYLGDAFAPTRGSIQFPLQSEYIDRSTVITVDSGYAISDIREKTQRFNVDWWGLTYQEKESIDDIFATYGLGIPFFISLDPNTAFGSTAGKHVRYVRFENQPSFQLISPNLFTLKMQLREEL